MTSRGKTIYDQQPRDGQRTSRSVIEDWLERESPEINVHQTSRWAYHITLTHGCISVSSWLLWCCSRKRLKRFTARKLTRYEKKLEREKRWERELEELNG